MLTLYFMNLAAGLSAAVLTKRLFRFSSLLDRLFAFFMVFISQIALMLLILGIFGVLTLTNLIMLLSAVLLGSLLVPRAKNMPAQARPESFEISLPGKFGLAVICAYAAVKLSVNLVNPPFGWDSLNYHFTFPVEWMKHGNLVNPIVISCDPAPTYYPVNAGLLFLWFIFPLKSAFIADLGQLPFFIIAFFCVYSIGRKIGISREYSFYGACLFSLVPNYFKQLDIAYVDIMVAALFLLALNFLFSLRNEFSFRNLTVFSLCLGFMLGTKTIALLYSLLLFAPFLFLCFKQNKIRRAAGFCLAGVLLILLLGGFSYARNFIQTGNPLYPLDIVIFGKSIFKGVVDSQVYRSGTNPQDYALAKILFSEGLGAQTVLLLFPGVFLGLPVYLWRRKRISFLGVYFMVLPVLIFLIYRFVIPLANLRYIYALLGIGIIIAFYILDALKFPRAAIQAVFILCVLASMGEMAKRAELVISIILSLALFIFLLKVPKNVFPGKFCRYSFAILVIVLLFLPFLDKDYAKNEFIRYVKTCKRSGFWPDAAEAWLWLSENASGANIAYIGRPVPFPLYGKKLKNNVYYASVNEVEPARLDYFKGSRYIWNNPESAHKSFERDGNYRGRAGFGLWLNNLRRKKTDYLFVYSLHHVKEIIFPVEDAWASAHPDVFERVFTDSIVRIYKIKPVEAVLRSS